MHNKRREYYFFKKQREGRLYNRIRATTGLVKSSILLRVCQFGERAEEKAKNTGRRRKDEGTLRQ